MKLYLPQLDIAFYEYWKNDGEITVTDIPTPVTYTDTMDEPANIFNLLFDNNYIHNSYSYEFVETPLTSLPSNIVSRVMVKGSIVRCYRVYSQGYGSITKNIMNIANSDIPILDCLLSYRQTGNADIASILYEELDTELSRLVYVYLDVYINENFKRIPELDNIPVSNKVLTELYRFYVINECHKLLKISKIWLDNTDRNYHINRKNIVVDNTILDNGYFTVDNPVPINDKSQMYIMYNGVQLLDNEFELIEDGGELRVQLTDDFHSKYTLKLNDVFIIQYYSEQMGVIVGTPIISKVDGGDHKLQVYDKNRPPTYHAEHTTYNIEDYI